MNRQQRRAARYGHNSTATEQARQGSGRAVLVEMMRAATRRQQQKQKGG